MINLLAIQWGIVGVFMLLHFILGFMRGTPKSTYYTIVSILMTILTLWLVSLFSVRWFFTPETLIQLINNYAAGVIPAEFLTYLIDPYISGFLFAIVDLVLRIIGFVIFYPMIKTSMTFTIFRPIWKRVFLPKLLAKQDEKLGITSEKQQLNKKARKSKRLKKNVLSRFGGGMAGAVRGFVVAFIFLLPIIVMAGFITAFDDSEPIAQNNDTQKLGFEQELNSLIPAEFQGYLNQVYDMHNNGLGGFFSTIKINDKSLDRAIFDMVFTTDIVVDDVTTEINFGQELESITGIVGVLVGGGYLDSTFDYTTINHDNLDDFEDIFTYISKSQLLGYMIPTVTRFGVKSILTDQIGVDLYDSPYSAEALTTFEAINWEEEFMRFYGILESTLEFGSVAELLNYANNPGLLAELSPEEGVALANIIRSFSELRTLGLLNVAVEYGLSTEGVRSQFSWLDEADLDTYLEARFAFILENPEFFYGEDSDWVRIAEMIEIIFSDAHGDIDLVGLYNQASDPAVLLNPDNAEWIGALIEKFVEIQLIMESIPVGVDFGLYNALGDQIERDLADRLAESFEAVNWDEEIINVSDIYKDILKLGLESAFGEDPNYYAIVDDIAVSHMDDMRSIIAKIFEDSQVVNLALEIAIPIVIETMITNDALRDIAEEVMFNDPDASEIDFNFGYEINQILTIIEVLNEFSSTGELIGFSGASTVERLEFISALGRLPEARFEAFTGAFSNLQLLERAGSPGLQYVKDTTGIEMLYVPTEVDLANDISTIFRVMYFVGGYMNEHELTYGFLEDIDFTEMLEDEDFRALLLSTPSQQHSELLFLNIAHNVKQGLAGIGLEAYLTIPEELIAASVEDDIWEVEINSFLDTIFNLMVSVAKTDDLTLSIRGMTEASQDTSGLIGSGLSAFLNLIDDNVDLDTGKDDFDRFLDSKIIYVSIAELLQGDFLSDIASGALSGVLGPDATLDISAPATVIGVEGIDEDIEVGRINKLEIKKIFSSIKVLGVTNPDEVSALGAQLITNMIDVNEPTDDFSVFLESDYLYVIIARLFSMEALGSFLGDALGGALGSGFDDISMMPPADAVGTSGVEQDLMTRIEVRQLFVSFKLLSPEGSLEGLGINTILDLIDDELLPGETDDFYLFLESKFMWDKISQLLLAEGIINLIANERYEASEFILPPSATITIDDEARLTQAEIHHLFSGLKQLGIGDLDTIDINIESIISLTDTEIDNLLQSSYLYTVIDLTIKTEESLTLPSGAFEDAGEFLGMIKKTEIKDVFKTLNILEINDLTNVSPETITIAQVNEVLLETDSFVVKYLISDAIVQALGANKVPDEAFLDGDRDQGVLSNLELEALMAALTILAGDDETQAITNIETENISVGNIEDLKGNESFVIKQLVSDAIVDIIGLDNIPPEAFVLGGTTYNHVLLGSFKLEGGPTNRLSDDEINTMIDAIVILANGDRSVLATDISTDVTVGQTKQLSLLPSFVIKQLVTNSIKDVIGEDKVPADAFVDGDTSGRLTDLEIEAMVEAIDILANQDDTLLVANLSTDVNVGQVKQLKTNTSLTIKQVLTDAIVDVIDPDGLGKIPLEAYEDSDPTGRLTDDEISEMIDAIVILANDDDTVLVTAISTDVNVGQLKAFKTNDSVIIKQLVSDSIVDTLSVDNTIPNDAYIDDDSDNRLTDDEINAMIDAIDILANGDDTLLVSAISTDVTVGQTQSLKINTSVIIRQLISDSITDTISLTATIPDDAYIDPVAKDRLKDTEINEMIDALYILANEDDDVLVSAISTDVTIGQLRGLSTSPSLIMRRLITDSIVDTIDPLNEDKIPLSAYVDQDTDNFLTFDEVEKMVGALEILANSDVAGDRDDVVVATLSPDITLGQLSKLTISESLIMQQLISDSIIDAVGSSKVPDDAYILDDSTLNLKSTEISAMVDALYILAYDSENPDQDLDTVKVDSVTFNVTVGQTQELKTNGSVIIKQVISDSIVDMLTLPKIRETAFKDPVLKDRLTDDEIGYMIDALLVLSEGDEDVLVTAITVNENTLSITALKDFNENSIILNRLISNAIIDGLGEADMPDESFEDDALRTDLIRPEIDALLDALDILGIGTGGAGAIATNQLTFANLDQVIAIGTTDLDKYPLGFSPIVVHVLSEPMITAVKDVRADDHDYGVPTTAYRDNGIDLLHSEIKGLIDALKLIGDVDEADEATTTIADITINANSFNGTLISNLVGLDKLIVYRLISKGINDSNIDTDPSHVTDVLARNYDPGLPGVPLVFDIKIAEMNHIAASMDTLGITSIATIATDITIAGLKTLTPLEIEALVEADTDGPNTIIYHIIAETVDSSNILFDTLVILDPVTYPEPADDYYVMDGATRVRLKRTSIALAIDAS